MHQSVDSGALVQLEGQVLRQDIHNTIFVAGVTVDAQHRCKALEWHEINTGDFAFVDDAERVEVFVGIILVTNVYTGVT